MDTSTHSTQFCDVPKPLRNDTSTHNAWQEIKYVFFQMVICCITMSYPQCNHILFYMFVIGRTQLVFYLLRHMSPRTVLHKFFCRAQLVFYLPRHMLPRIVLCMFLGRAQLVFYLSCSMLPRIVLHMFLGRAQLVLYHPHHL